MHCCTVDFMKKVLIGIWTTTSSLNECTQKLLFYEINCMSFHTPQRRHAKMLLLRKSYAKKCEDFS